MGPVIQQQYRPKSAANKSSRRTDQEWVLALRGDFGDAEQHTAHVELSAYLYTTAWNYLLMQQPTISKIAHYAPEDLQPVAEDFVQTFCLKLFTNNFNLLDKYSQKGRFLSWAAQVLKNAICSELRRNEWKLSCQLDETIQFSDHQALTQQTYRPETLFHRDQLSELVESLLSKFSYKNRIIFQRYVVDGERASVVAKELGISSSGVYTAAHRIREQMSASLTNAGYAY